MKSDVLEKRKVLRSLFHCPIEFTGDIIHGKGIVINLSSIGCGVASDTKVQERAYLYVRVFLPDHDVPMKIELAAVVWAKEGIFGLEFIRMQPKAQERLQQFVLEMIPEP